MNYLPGYVLVIDHSTSDLQSTAEASESILQSLHCPVVITDSPEQAVAKAQSHHPHLVILSGDVSDQSPQIAKKIRQSVQPEEVVIVSLSKSSEFSWMSEPNSVEIDGFFVEPLSVDVLSALNQSAIVKKTCLLSV